MIINQIIDPTELALYRDDFDLIYKYLDLKVRILDSSILDVNHEIMIRHWKADMAEAWIRLPFWAKELLERTNV